jgi:hypothetical protein
MYSSVNDPDHFSIGLDPCIDSIPEQFDSTLIEKGTGNSRLYDGWTRLNVLCDGTPFLTP